MTVANTAPIHGVGPLTTTINNARGTEHTRAMIDWLSVLRMRFASLPFMVAGAALQKKVPWLLGPAEKEQ